MNNKDMFRGIIKLFSFLVLIFSMAAGSSALFEVKAQGTIFHVITVEELHHAKFVAHSSVDTHHHSASSHSHRHSSNEPEHTHDLAPGALLISLADVRHGVEVNQLLPPTVKLAFLPYCQKQPLDPFLASNLRPPIV